MSGKSEFDRRKPAIRHLLKRHFPFDADAVVLDAGCGRGDWMEVLKQTGCTKATGVEIQKLLALEAEKRTGFPVKPGSLESFLPTAADSYFGGILAIDILEHIAPGSQQNVLHGFFRSLKTGAPLLLRVPNATGIFGMSVFFGDEEHESAFTAEVIKRKLLEAGFQKIEIFEDPPVVYSAISLFRRFLWTLFSIPFRVIWFAETGVPRSFLTRNIVVSAKK